MNEKTFTESAPEALRYILWRYGQEHTGEDHQHRIAEVKQWLIEDNPPQNVINFDLERLKALLYEEDDEPLYDNSFLLYLVRRIARGDDPLRLFTMIRDAYETNSAIFADRIRKLEEGKSNSETG